MAKNSKENRGESHRVQRVEREIRETIGTYLLGGFRGELPGIVSVSRVICTKDLRSAKVFVTIMGFGADVDVDEPAAARKLKSDKKEAIAELQAHAHEAQHAVNKRLQMKHCPKLTFIYDEGFEHAMKVESILRDISMKRESEATKSAEVETDDDEG